MKAEERHRLQTNELSVWTARAGELWKQYGTYVLLGAIALVLLTAAVAWWNQYSQSQAAAGWDDFRAARDENTAAAYADVAERHDGTAVAWARFWEGRIALRTGLQLVFENRKGAYRELAAARKAFEDVLSNADARNEVREQAQFRLAQTLEALAGVRESDDAEAPAATVDEAIAAYETFLNDFSDSVLKPPAEEQIAQLKKDSMRDFYAWFAQQTPSPADRRAPRDPATSPGSEFDLGDLDALLQSKKPGPTTPPAGGAPEDEPVEAPTPGGNP